MNQQFNAGQDDENYDSSDDLAPLGWEQTNSFFLQQFQQFLEKRNQTYETNNHLLVDSGFRNVRDQIESNYLQTQNNYLACVNHVMYIKIPISYQLKKHSENKIPESIHVILVNNDPEQNLAPIGGLSPADVIYDEETGGPIWEAELDTFDTETNIVKYKLLGVDPLEYGYYGEGISLKLVTSLIRGYPEANHFTIQCKKSLQNVTQIKILSSEFPRPSFLPKTSRDPDYSVTVDIPRISLRRNLVLDVCRCRNNSSVIRELTRGLDLCLKDQDICAIGGVSKVRASSDISLLHRVINPHNINLVKSLPNESLLLQTQGDEYIPENQIVYVHLNTPVKLKGVYRTNQTSLYWLRVQPNTDSWDPPTEKLFRMFQDDLPIGYVSSIEHQEDTDTVGGYQIFLSVLDPQQIVNGVRIRSQDRSLVCQVLEAVRLGPSNVMHLDWVGNLSASANIDDTFSIEEQVTRHLPKGIYLSEEFGLNFPLHSILSKTGLRGDGTIRLSYNTYPEANWVPAKLKQEPVGDEYTLTIARKNLPLSKNGYEVMSVQTTHSVEQNNSHLHYHQVILHDQDDESNPRLYLSQGQTNRPTRGQWVWANRLHSSPRYIQVKDVLDNGDTLILERNRLSDDDKIISIATPDADLQIQNKNTITRVSGILSDILIRNSQEALVFPDQEYSEDSLDGFRPGFIVRIGKNVDGRLSSNSELNVIHYIEPVPSAENDLLIHLRFPTSNSRIGGDLITQQYLYLELGHRYYPGEMSLVVESPIDLEKLPVCRGCVNWLTESLVHNGTSNEFVSEEPFTVLSADKINDQAFRLNLKHPLSYRYLESYLVLFVNPDLSRADPPTLSRKYGDDWYTGVLVHDSYANNQGQELYIFGTEGEEVPVFGLSQSDFAARGMKGLDMESNLEHMFDLYTSPDSQQTLLSVPREELPLGLFSDLSETPDNLVIVRGRYGFRNGLLRWKRSSVKLSTDTSRSSIMIPAVRGPVGTIQTRFSSRLLRRDMQHHQEKVNSKDISVLVRPKDPPFVPEKYSYFYVCSPTLANLILPNGEITKYRAQKGWSFLNDEPESKDILDQRQKTFPHKDYLQSIFAKIQLYDKNSASQATDSETNNDTLQTDNILYNTFVNTPLRFDNPIHQIDNLEFVCLWPNGQLVDFQGRDYSLTLEVTEKLGTLRQVNARTGLVERC